MQQKTKASKLDNIVSKTQGRFFGLRHKNGNIYNAKLVASTDQYLTIFDRNLKSEVKMLKSSVSSIKTGGKQHKFA